MNSGWIQPGDQRNLRHGMAATRIYWVWKQMRQRCNNPKNRSYKNYGGRGIRVCKRWAVFENFLADMGECPPGLTIERRNNSGNYTPANCYWATRLAQAHNKRERGMTTN